MTNAESSLGNAELATLRDALAAAVQDRSLRAVARELEMSPTGLRGLLDGADPYNKTWSKIRLWYARHAGGDGSPVAPRSALALLQMALRDIPLQHRDASCARILSGYRDAYASAGISAPTWLNTASTDCRADTAN